MMKRRRLFLTVPICIASFPLAGHAYVDPVAGSLLLQLLLGGVAGLLVFVRMFKTKILSFLGLKKREPGE